MLHAVSDAGLQEGQRPPLSTVAACAASGGCLPCLRSVSSAV